MRETENAGRGVGDSSAMSRRSAPKGVGGNRRSDGLMALLDARWIIRAVGKLTHGRNSNPASLIRAGIRAEYRIRGRGIFVFGLTPNRPRTTRTTER